MKYKTQRVNSINPIMVQSNLDYLAYRTDNTHDEAETEADPQSNSLNHTIFWLPPLFLMAVPKREEIIFGKHGMQSTFPNVKCGYFVCLSHCFNRNVRSSIPSASKSISTLLL